MDRCRSAGGCRTVTKLAMLMCMLTLVCGTGTVVDYHTKTSGNRQGRFFGLLFNKTALFGGYPIGTGTSSTVLTTNAVSLFISLAVIIGLVVLFVFVLTSGDNSSDNFFNFRR